MTSLVCENLRLELGGNAVLTDVSARFSAGQLGVVLGPNGAGKSSLLSCLAGLRRPGSGLVMLGGEDVAPMNSVERGRRIGYMPQARVVHWDLEVAELVALGRLARRSGWAPLSAADTAAIEGALQRTGTASFARRRFSTLSGGEQARVLLARVLAGEPEWILADEPLAGLDPAHAVQMLTLLRDLAHSGKGVVLVLHDLAMAHWAADHVVMLQGGSKVAEGDHTILHEPAMVRRVFDIEIDVVGCEPERPRLVTRLP